MYNGKSGAVRPERPKLGLLYDLLKLNPGSENHGPRSGLILTLDCVDAADRSRRRDVGRGVVEVRVIECVRQLRLGGIAAVLTVEQWLAAPSQFVGDQRSSGGNHIFAGVVWRYAASSA